jgi:3',5'-cyclic-AMP phosphodiesterase
MRKALTGLALMSCLLSCKNLFHYSPNEVRLEESEKRLNQKNIEKISRLPVSDTFRFIVIGDSQRFYDEMDDFITAVNRLQNIAFVLLNGDIVDFGLDREFKWINQRMSRLNVPYVAVIGNHDMLANARLIYNQMFGPENFTFSFGRNKFICLNSNSQETGFDGTLPNMGWLQSQLSNTNEERNVFVVGHVPPFSNDFDPALVNSYTRTLSSNNKVRLSINGHLHSYQFSEPYHDGVGYLVPASMNQRSYVIVSVMNENYDVQQVFY